VSRVRAADGITATKAKAEFCIKRSARLEDRTKERILGVLKDLPDGDSLCHGDFHPGNIICDKDSRYLIDWVGASRGDFCADVAHTYVLLRVVPRVPHMSRVMHFMQKRVGQAVADRYLTAILSGTSFDHERLSKWVFVNAAERTYHGLESEQERLQRFIDMYLAVLDRGGNQGQLYRAI
jgi:hypothetical protein